MNTMSMRTWWSYRKTDGIFTGAMHSADTFQEIAGNESGDIGLIAGVSDWQSQRVNLLTRELVEYQPPLPDADHEWDPQAKRVIVKVDVSVRRAKKRRGQDDVDALDRKTIRTVRELVISICASRTLTAAEKKLFDRLKKLNDDAETIGKDSGVREDDGA